jgi:hypothetical protein
VSLEAASPPIDSNQHLRLSATPRAGSLTGKTVSIGFSVV